MRDSDIVKGLMPDIVHPHSTLDFTDLKAQCELPRVKANFEEILDEVTEALMLLEHVSSVQVTGTEVVVTWDYALPSVQVARRDMEPQRVVKEVLTEHLAELISVRSNARP